MSWFLVQGVPYNPGGGGGQPPYPTTGPGFPTNPIAGMGPGGNFPNQPPLGIWGGSGVGDYIDAGLPGHQPSQPPRPWGPINYPDIGFPGPQPIPGWGPGFPTNPIVIPIPPGTPGAPEGGGAVAVIPAGTSIVSTQDIEIPNPADPENPFKIPAGTVIVTSQPILIPTGYAPPAAQPPVATPQE